MMNKISTIDFYPMLFQDIPEQDNPAHGNTECLMIVGEANTNSGHAIVLHIVPDPTESVTHIAKFWEHEDAIRYCETMA